MNERYMTCVYFNKDTGCDKSIFSCTFCPLYKSNVKLTIKAISEKVKE